MEGEERVPAIIVDRLSKSFDYYKKEAGLSHSFRNLFYRKPLRKDAVTEISFRVEEAEMVGFLGPNGAGKTTTLKMLTGILHPTAGEASVLGYVPWERRKAFKKQFAIVMGQKSQLWWDLPANESLMLNKCIYEIEDRSFNRIVGELSELLGVRDLLSVQVRRLSLGERMKLELIAALLHEPKVLFLDEPTIGLDLLSQRKIREFLKTLNRERRTTVLLTSHNMNDIVDLCKRTVIINGGKVIYDGDLAKVNGWLDQRKIVRVSLAEPVERRRLEAYGIVRSVEDVEAVLEVEKADVKEQAKRILDDLPVVDFTIEDVSIEEGIAQLYRNGSEEIGGEENESAPEIRQDVRHGVYALDGVPD